MLESKRSQICKGLVEVWHAAEAKANLLTIGIMKVESKDRQVMKRQWMAMGSKLITRVTRPEKDSILRFRRTGDARFYLQRICGEESCRDWFPVISLLESARLNKIHRKKGNESQAK